MSRAQKGRKPRKAWHRGATARVWDQVEGSWPDTGVDARDAGQPQPLRQGQSGYRFGKRARRS